MKRIIFSLNFINHQISLPFIFACILLLSRNYYVALSSNTYFNRLICYTTFSRTYFMKMHSKLHAMQVNRSFVAMMIALNTRLIAEQMDSRATKRFERSCRRACPVIAGEGVAEILNIRVDWK